MPTAAPIPAPTTEAERTSGPPACAHCGQPCRTLYRDEHAADAEPFCCHGCAAVYRLLHQEGADRFYALRDRPLDPARPSYGTYAHFDDATFHAQHVTERADGTAHTDLRLDGVRCAACVWLVERLPRMLPGVIEARLDLGRARARVAWDPRVVALSEIARTLDRFGYPAHAFRDAPGDSRRREDRDYLIRLAVVGASAGNVMLVAFALYGGFLHGMAISHEAFLRWASLLAALPAVIWGGGVFFAGAIQALRARVLHMDLPIAIGIAVAFGASAVHTVAGHGDVYFDSVTVLIFLLLGGRWLQRRHHRHAARATELAAALVPSTARRVVGDSTEDVPVQSLGVGDRLRVRAAETIAADGAVVTGESRVDRALLTGEARTEAVGPGDRVFAGTVNVGAPIDVTIESIGDQTRVGALMRLVEDGTTAVSTVQALADRIAGRFVAAVLLIATTTLAVWLAIDPSRAAANAIAVLVITCPCALGLATPLAAAAAVGQAARRGILLKDASLLERLASSSDTARRVWLDKTGTITARSMRIAHWSGDDASLALAAALERAVAHPIADAFAGIDTASKVVRDVRHATSGGVIGRVDDHDVRIGALRWIDSLVPVDVATRSLVERFARAGHTPLVVTVDDAVAGVVAIGDAVRPDAQQAIERMRRHGWRVGILSGDHEGAVRALARTLDIPPEDAIGDQSPEAKLERIKRDAAAGVVMMVGDGVNDAAALAAADVGVAIRGGAEASLDAADVFLSEAQLTDVAALIEGAHRTRGVIRRNLVLSLSYNVIGVTLSMFGWVNPLVAAILMPISSLTVITSSYRARTFTIADRTDEPREEGAEACR